VRAGNAAALALYRRFGFAQSGCRRGYYPDNGEDALLLTRDIPPPVF
jgi:ribosomal-protein-alanine N-acetyltransferase